MKTKPRRVSQIRYSSGRKSEVCEVAGKNLIIAIDNIGFNFIHSLPENPALPSLYENNANFSFLSA